jgi:hypothetical protein
MIDRKGLRARVQRLEELSMGLMKERDLWKGCDHPLTGVEVQEYLAALTEAVAGIERARKVMSQAYWRLEEG